MHPFLRLPLSCLLALFTLRASATPVINEIMFHPPGLPENPAQEWIELYNDSTTATLDLTGWKFTKGVNFTLGSVSLAPGAYLVVAADVAAFQAAHPGFAGQVVGGWVGKLSNSGETIRLENAVGAKIDEVAYAEEGDWALRSRGLVSFSHQGWIWESAADGAGSTLELRNPVLSSLGSGQNWGVSPVAGGSPGAVNALASTNVAPLVSDVKHRPEIPRTTDPIVVSAKFTDDAASLVTTALHWRADGAATFTTVPMVDLDGDGDREATIPAQATNLTVIEYYIEAGDGTFTRTWPAQARTTAPGVLPATYAQVTNALLQVDNAYDPNATFRTAADSPLYRLIMTNVERLELAQIGSTNGQQQSEATMNGTFISHDGTGVKVVYNAGFRNRGFSSALGPPNNFNISFRSDDLWNGRGSIAMNCQYGYSQALGNALFDRAGIPPQETAVARMRVNGADLAEGGARMYGRYARIEGRSGAWAANHYPNDSDGNFYRLDDHAYAQGDPLSGEFRYEGSDPALYSDTFFKETNQDANDYSDLINLARIISAPATGGTAGQPAISDAAYPASVATVLDVDQFYRFIATDALIGNREGGLQSGRADDTSIYRGVTDTRFRFVPHDLDDVFAIGNGIGDSVTRSIFSYDISSGGVTGLPRMFNHPQLVPRYYSAVLDAMNSWFTSATVDPLIDRLMAGWVPASNGASAQSDSIAEIKAYVTSRRANVLTQIQQSYTLTTTVGGTTTAEGYLRTNDGSATFSGKFNVAKTYSITVNGVPVSTMSYRPASLAVDNWSLAVPAGGGTVLHPGLNRVVVKFWDGINGTGSAVNTLTADVLYQPLTPTYNNVAGAITAGSLRLTAPATFIPGKPFLVRADVLDGAGNVDRTAWDGTVSLTASSGGVTLPSIQLYNGTGSALATAGGAAGLPPTVLMSYGTGGNGTAGSGVAGSAWKEKHDFNTTTLATFITNTGNTWRNEGFDDSTWATVNTQTGYGNNDENTPISDLDYDAVAAGSQNVPCYLFRKTFTIADVNAIASVTGQIKYDDGYAIYVNGVDINQRANLTAGLALTSYATGPSADNATASFTIPLNVLHNGVNTIAVDVRQANATSSDVTFDMQLQINYPAADPGNFTVTGSYTGGTAAFTAQKAMTSLTSTPAITPVTGTLAVGTTSWSGVIQVTGDVTVPTGGTLNIAAGTHVLVDGDATAGSTAGRRIIVNGTLNSNGTFAAPVAISATNGADRWGGFLFSAAQPSVMNYTLINHAGHTAGVGHTGRGPMIRLTGSSLNFDDSVLADGPAKAIYTSGTLDLNIRRSLIERMITGPELEDGAALLVEDSNIQRILPDYRESTSNVPDDEDCLYIHNASARSVIMRRSVFARCGDDVFDGLGGPLVVEDSILREGWDKGMSLLNNDLTITRTQIIKCDKAIVPKSNSAATRTVTATNCTIVSEDHNTTLPPWGYAIAPSSPDADTPSTGFYTQNKAGQSNTAAILAINAKNCIVIAQSPALVDAPYSPANTVVTYSDLTLPDYSAFAWPGTGNIGADPLFAGTASGNYRITSTSPCRNTGDPATTDPDTSIADMGALYFGGGGAAGGVITWTPAGGPYRLTASATVPIGTTLSIQPGTAVYFDQNVRLTVNGRIIAAGSAGQRITFSHVPGTVAAGDADPLKFGVQTGPPKWGGIRVTDSMADENAFRYCDFINAQGTDPATAENYGSVGFVRSWGWVDHCTWAGSHLRLCYGRNSKLTVTHSVFPDMFIFDPVLGRIEEPTTDFIAAADNRMEPLKVEFPTTEAEVLGVNAPNFPNGLPLNGHWRVYYNDFNGNRGHQDVFDADSGRWAPRDVSGNQTNGQFMLDCRFNHFHGLAGDEHIDLGGDAYIASNIFERAAKDYWTNDTGYSNAISSGDKGTGTTIMVVRNLCFDIDHVINCKLNTATIFEHNTVANMHADFTFTGQTVTQNVVCAPINFYISGDGGSPTYGDGAYMGFNLVSNVPHMFSGPDTRDADPGAGINNVNDITTKIEFNNNLLDQIADPVIGANHPGGYFSGTYGPNTAGAPGFVNAAAKDYSLRADSPARRTTPHGFDYGASIPEWAYIVGGPAGITASASASFTIGGPGIVAYKWRLDGGAWSASIQIGDGGLLPRATPTVRQATLNLTSLTSGVHTLEVLGQDMAGNWQDADPARTLEGLAQAAPTVRTWTVDPTFVPVRLSEILADSATLGDTVELQNISGGSVSMTGWSLTDDPLVPGKLPLSGTIAAGAYATFTSTLLSLDKDGDTVYLYQGATLRDSVTFGQQIADRTIGRDVTGAWTLCTPSLGLANTPTPAGDYSTVRISEWFASADVLYSGDWIELQNTNTNPVLLTGLRLTDNRAGDASAYTFPALSYIAGSGYVRVVADGSNSPGHLPFSLDAEYETLSLLGAGDALLDTVAFYPQTTDYSMGRDALGNIVFYELPTRGLLNGASDPAYANALAMLRGLRITEIMFNAIGGSDYDYVELRNVGASAFSIGGVTFVQGIAFTFPAQTLAPGQSIVVCKSLAKFRARYGSGPLVAGTFTGQLDNGGETVAIQLPPPFDANVLTFGYSDGWQPSTDGLGKSLVVLNPLVKAGVWGDKDTWTASAGNGGDPDGAGPLSTTYSGWSALHAVFSVGEDRDFDAVGAFTEYAFGETTPDTESSGILPGIAVTPTSHAKLLLDLPVNAAAVQTHGMAETVYVVQASDDLLTWTTIATKSPAAAWSGTATVTVGPAAAGFVPVTVEDMIAAPGQPTRFLRVQLDWVP